MAAPASHYYEPRPAPRTPQRRPLPSPTFLEAHGELIAASLGLVAFGLTLGIVLTAAIIGALG